MRGALERAPCGAQRLERVSAATSHASCRRQPAPQAAAPAACRDVGRRVGSRSVQQRLGVSRQTKLQTAQASSGSVAASWPDDEPGMAPTQTPIDVTGKTNGATFFQACFIGCSSCMQLVIRVSKGYQRGCYGLHNAVE